jgi:hypothetical protein
MTTKRLLQSFSDCVAELTNALDQGIDLSEEEDLYVENHLLKLQLAYTKWKRLRQNDP